MPLSIRINRDATTLLPLADSLVASTRREAGAVEDLSPSRGYNDQPHPAVRPTLCSAQNIAYLSLACMNPCVSFQMNAVFR